MEKYQAFWPLPGGGDQYVDALQKVLLFIKGTRPTEDQIRDWFFENFGKVHRPGATRGYIRNTLWHSGLVGRDGKRHFLTEAGVDYLRPPVISVVCA